MKELPSEYKESFKAKSRVFQGIFKGVWDPSRQIEACFNGVLSGFQGICERTSFRGILRVFQGSFNSVSSKFQ